MTVNNSRSGTVPTALYDAADTGIEARIWRAGQAGTLSADQRDLWQRLFRWTPTAAAGVEDRDVRP